MIVRCDTLLVSWDEIGKVQQNPTTPIHVLGPWLSSLIWTILHQGRTNSTTTWVMTLSPHTDPSEILINLYKVWIGEKRGQKAEPGRNQCSILVLLQPRPLGTATGIECIMFCHFFKDQLPLQRGSPCESSKKHFQQFLLPQNWLNVCWCITEEKKYRAVLDIFQQTCHTLYFNSPNELVYFPLISIFPVLASLLPNRLLTPVSCHPPFIQNMPLALPIYCCTIPSHHTCTYTFPCQSSVLTVLWFHTYPL